MGQSAGELREQALAKLASLEKPASHTETTRTSPATDP